jgi:hypothetical protein
MVVVVMQELASRVDSEHKAAGRWRKCSDW